ncbi:MAG TPA: decarboxylating 6-phosphogluconate dehydrogenase [Candidatus Babeliales bacterium]|nr:decarboxylating 6-phosphogluconate dehydrogenase [Candidatus Babeliales bacterium]
MKIAIIGLGKMGQAIAHRAMQAGFTVFGFDPNATTAQEAAECGVRIVNALHELKNKDIHVFWLMVPQGTIVDNVINELRSVVQAHDIIIDGGNSKFSDSMQRAQELAKEHIYFMDCGTSGGIHGQEHGFCLMIGGDKTAYEKIESLFKAVAMPGGYAYLGTAGAGHYVKMVHNGIEYGILQAYAEGFHLLKDGAFKNEHLDLATIAALWNHGSVIRSWILELVYDIMKEDPQLSDIEGKIASTGMGLWTVEQAHESGIPVPVIEESLNVRAWSEKTGGNYATKVVAMLRNKFGGHAVLKK